ncbi:MAG: hypothetical protein AAF138_06830 [Planctomycetota bacterium]
MSPASNTTAAASVSERPGPSGLLAGTAAGTIPGNTGGTLPVDPARLELLAAKSKSRTARVVMDVVDESLTRSKRLREEAQAERAERDQREAERAEAAAERERLEAEQAERRAELERQLEEQAARSIDLLA